MAKWNKFDVWMAMYSVDWAEDRAMLTVRREDLEKAKAAVREYIHPSIHVIYNIVD